MADLRSLVELVRAPAALSVPGDVLAGAAAAGRPLDCRVGGAVAASVCLYWAGMALNDYADRHLDIFERPERPLPSGRVRPETALALARGLTAAGLGIAGMTGGIRALAVTVPLAAAVWGYDLRWKDGPAGPAAMAAARALDVLNGAGLGGLRAAAPAAAVVGVHTVAVTVLSRQEVEGATRETATATALLAGAAASGALAMVCSARTYDRTADISALMAANSGPSSRRFAGWSSWLGLHEAHHGRHGVRSVPDSGQRYRPVIANPAKPHHRIVAAAMAADYTRRFGTALAAVTRDGHPATVRKAVGAGIMSLMPLQASLIASRGRLPAALPIAAAGPLARRLARRISPT
jgi:4-hydroxybenzoate polyprenyltransferase